MLKISSQKKWAIPLLLLFVFGFLALWRFFVTDDDFFFFNFVFIGIILALGVFLSLHLQRKSRKWVRIASQLIIGSYFLFYLGFIEFENMQIEGFFFYLFAGVFAAATLQYFVAKIIGPLVFGRGWCGWACWTVMILDLLPWKIPRQGRYRYFGLLRYVHFLISLLLAVYVWYILENKEVISHSHIELFWVAIGNIIYFMVGIILAYLLKDNRAFCKYVCPIPSFQKIFGRFSILKPEIDKNLCNDCGVCEKVCPQNVKLLTYKNKGQRILSTECVLCAGCVNSCPKKAIAITAGLDVGFREQLNFRPILINNLKNQPSLSTPLLGLSGQNQNQNTQP